MKAPVPDDRPTYAVPEGNLVPVSEHLTQMATIPPSRMFLIKKSLRTFQAKHPGEPIYDASQGDGGASLPGVPRRILERAAELLYDHGTAYDMPYGSDDFRTAVIEKYWQPNASLGVGPTNVLAAMGGRDALVKAYQSMLTLGRGRQGDVIIVSRVPWISYNWGPYGIGANVMYAPGNAANGWAYTPETIRACVDYATRSGRKVAGLIITNPDNPTGRTISTERQVELAKAALSAGVAYVLFDWIYHYVTDSKPMDLNAFLDNFLPDERKRLIFLDGVTKSLGGSNIRNAHLIASEELIKFIVARASHGVIPSYYSQAVAIAAYEMGYTNACRSIVEPTNASRQVLRSKLEEHGYEYILGKGYYAFINFGEWIEYKGWPHSELLGRYLAEEYGVAIVPGVFFSQYGGDWIRFSYATPPERTLGAFERLVAGLSDLES
jgi:aspartate aminotransferase